MEPQKQNSITTLPTLSVLRLENLFNIYKNDKNYFYNLIGTVNIPANLDPSVYDTFVVTTDNMPWTLISYKAYKTIDLWWNGDDVMGKIEILPTPSGNILKALLIAGITVGISSRAMGSVKQIGETVEVQDDLELVCWDFVSTPSTQGAFMEIVSESLNPNAIKTDKYQKINELITEILCNRAGFCSCELPGQ